MFEIFWTTENVKARKIWSTASFAWQLKGAFQTPMMYDFHISILWVYMLTMAHDLFRRFFSLPSWHSNECILFSLETAGGFSHQASEIRSRGYHCSAWKNMCWMGLRVHYGSFGGFLWFGVAPNHPKFQCLSIFQPIVTWGSPIFRHTPPFWLSPKMARLRTEPAKHGEGPPLTLW